MGMMGAIFLLPVFAQTYMGYGATQTGYLFIPMAAAMMMTAPIGAMIVNRMKVEPRWIIFFSSLFATIGIFGFTFIDAKSGALDIILPLFIMALGMGFGMSPRTNIVSNAVPAHEIGSASSVLALARNISGAFGIALFATILANATNTHIVDLMNNSALRSAVPANVQIFAALVQLKAQVLAYKDVFLISTVISFFGAFSALFIRLNKERGLESVQVE